MKCVARLDFKLHSSLNLTGLHIAQHDACLHLLTLFIQSATFPAACGGLHVCLSATGGRMLLSVHESPVCLFMQQVHYCVYTYTACIHSGQVCASLSA